MPVTISNGIHIPRDLISGGALKHMLHHLVFLPRQMGTDPVEPIEMYSLTDEIISIPIATPDSILPEEVRVLISEAVVEVSFGQHCTYPSRPDPDHPAVKDPEAQRTLMLLMLESAHNNYAFVAQAATGTGKCLHPDQGVIMYDGSIRKAKDIKKGEHVLGPDSKPRNVLHVNKGRGLMYEVIPTKGESFKCNDVHILSLVNTESGAITNVPINEYLRWTKWKKHTHKLYRASVDFPDRDAPKLDAYFMGVFLGDGGNSSGQIKITSVDDPIIECIHGIADKYDLTVRKDGITYCYSQTGTKANNVPDGNYVRKVIQDYGLVGSKFIPDDYKLGDRDVRLQVLAGLLDTDGYLGNKTHYDFISKYKSLSDDVAFVCRSLGLAAYIKECRKTCTNTGASGTYYRVSISGDTNIIPCRIDRKKASPRKQKKNVLRTGFKLRNLGEGDYCGMVLDGDHLYCLDDFTVTHNTACALNTIAELETNALVIVPTEVLANQWIESAVNLLKIDKCDIGRIQGSKIDVEGKKLVIGIVNSLAMKDYPEWVYSHFGAVIVDECHRVGSYVFSNAVPRFNARYKIGLSATPKRKDGADTVIHYYLGPITAKSEAKALFTRVYRIDYRTRGKIWGNNHGSLMKCLSLDRDRNNLIVKCVKKLYSINRNILVVSDSIQHLQNLMSMCEEAGIPRSEMGQFTGQRYKSDGKKVKITKEELDYVKENSRIIFATYSMMKEGVDEPRLDAGIDATPRSDATQLVGRIRRPFPNKPRPVWYTIVDIGSKKLLGYYYKRKREYLSGNMEVIEQ